MLHQRMSCSWSETGQAAWKARCHFLSLHNCLAKAQTPICNHWHELCSPLAERPPGHLHLSFKHGLGQVWHTVDRSACYHHGSSERGVSRLVLAFFR